ncbi:hypothetical protein [Virgibacillus salexigens]|uniref:Uncharacterized protein n=1 Tax=Virgibacillus kapii TaxID=1638645 RepID=A0ABQ2DW16_9BACI|nr:hypothetical protein [Virgibacillus kapii]GGJ75351.1 hypothetical protein GCM10007111_41130 [Virgibacillus kapii]
MQPLKLIKSNPEKLDEDTNGEVKEKFPDTNKKPNKMIQLLQKFKHQKKVKKEFQEDMKEQGKKPKLLKQTSAILPFVQIHDEYILLKEGVMDIFQVQTKNVHALNDADLNYLLLNRAQFLRSYFRSFKEIILNFPTNTEVQRAYWLKKQQQAKNPSRLKYIEQKLFEFKYLERERYNREFFMFIYADDKEELEDRKSDCMQGMQSSFPLRELPKNKKEQILFLLNNQNTQL